MRMMVCRLMKLKVECKLRPRSQTSCKRCEKKRETVRDRTRVASKQDCFSREDLFKQWMVLLEGVLIHMKDIS
eukprot:m.251166 g.251166  ORF g.251166 m.251166 type:complete len:73 (+) comp15447_c0_seq1:244-462(+)